MKPVVVAVMLLIFGCAPGPRLAPPPSVSPAGWSEELSIPEKARLKEVAWKAAASPAMLEKFQVKRISRGPIQLFDTFIQYEVWNKTNFASVEVCIPSSGRFGAHGCFIGVTIDRSSYEVLSMRESFWP